MKIRNIIIFLIIIGSVAFSARYSSEVYRFYLDSWYRIIRGQSREDLVRYAQKLLVEKKYPELLEFSREMLLLYPDDTDLRDMAGTALIRQGKTGEGLELLITSAGKQALTPGVLKDTIRILYAKGRYNNIIEILRERNYKEDPELLFFYGVSLYNRKQYKPAARALKQAVASGYDDIDTVYFLGLALSNAGNSNAALPYLKRARIRYSRDPDLNRALYRAYRDLGRFNDAEKILRLIK